MKIKKQRLIFFILFLFPFSLNAQLNTQSQDTEVNLIVQGCNNNSICEAVIGENNSSCPLDCPVTTPVPEEENEQNRKKSSRIRSDENVFLDILKQTDDYKNISSVKASVEGGNVFLSWFNPISAELDYVRVMRNEKFSNNPYEGTLIYEGLANNFKDKIDDLNKNYYYSFFTRYKNKDFSSAVVIEIRLKQPTIFDEIKRGIEKTYEEKIKIQLDKPFESVFFADGLTIYDLSFKQGEHSLSWKKDVMYASPGQEINVFLPKKDFFGPINNVYLYANFYNKNKDLFKQDFLKLDYDSSSQNYVTKLQGFSLGDRIEFRVIKIDSENKESIVSGTLEIKEISSQETENIFVKTYNFVKDFLAKIILFFKDIFGV